MSDTLWMIPAGNANIEPAREVFTKALLGVSLTILITPDDIAKIQDAALRENAQHVYDEAVADAMVRM